MMRKAAVFLICVAAVWLMGPAAAIPTSDCMAGLRTSLIEGDFSGPLVCSKVDATVVLVGHTREDKYSIYDYRYRFLPEDGSIMHGGQKIIVFQDSKYIGQYSLSPPPYSTISICGSRVFVESRDGGGTYSLDLSVRPPNEAFVDGEIIIFYR